MWLYRGSWIVKQNDMKKTLLPILVFLSAGARASGHSNADSLVLKQKMEQVEKLVKQLQQEIRTLKANDSTLSAEINTLRNAMPPSKKKLVIDRRGSKQATFQ